MGVGIDCVASIGVTGEITPILVLLPTKEVDKIVEEHERNGNPL